MKENKFFPKQQSKLKNEAILRALLCGLAVGFGANFIVSLIFWLLPANGLWICLAVLVIATAVATPIFYIKRFRTNDTMNARRIDRLGLEERLITMVELEDNDSFIAQAQRRDAQAALETVDNRQLKIKISKAVVAAALICGIFGLGMTVVNGLAESGLLPGGDKLLENFVKEQKTVYVMANYLAEDGGYIEGDVAQILVQDTDAQTVTAVADDGYMFKCWSDGKTEPTRTDLTVMEDVTFTAIFIEVDDDGALDDDGQGDKPNDAPGGKDDQGNDEGDSDDPKDPDDSDEESSGGGAWDPNNKIINGEIYYRDVLEEYQDAAEELLQDPESGLTEEEKELIKKYLGIV